MVSFTSQPLYLTGRETDGGSYCIGGWVGPRAGLDDVERRNVSYRYWEPNPNSSVVQPGL
jgi:hypothetical protein